MFTMTCGANIQPLSTDGTANYWPLPIQGRPGRRRKGTMVPSLMSSLEQLVNWNPVKLTLLYGAAHDGG